MDEAAFENAFSLIINDRAKPELITKVKEYLRTVTDGIWLRIPLHELLQVQDLELFSLLVQKAKTLLDSLLFELMVTPGKEDHYRILLQKTVVGKRFKADLIGTDLTALRLNTLRYLTASNQQSCKVYIARYDSLQDVLRHGFVPSFFTYGEETEKIIILLEHLNVPKETLSFFFDISLPKHIAMFEMLTQEAALQLYEQVRDTTSMLRWTFPHLLYSSQRLCTDMSMFRTPFSNVGSVVNTTLKTDFGPYAILKPQADNIWTGKYALPVIRYAQSTTGGYYHDEPKEHYCGTFYYHEPESSTYLLGEKILVAETKYSATKQLFEKSNVNGAFHRGTEALLETQMDSPLDQNWEKKKLKLDLRYTPKEFLELQQKFVANEELKSEFRGDYFLDEVSQVPIYCGQLLGLYAGEDGFDQVLCSLAKELGYDLVVLTRMVGAKQIVTEVLDARTREESFQNLIFTY